MRRAVVGVGRRTRPARLHAVARTHALRGARRGVAARAIARAEGAAGRADSDAALDAAAELIEKCGIGALAPKLAAWRAEVAQILDGSRGGSPR